MTGPDEMPNPFSVIPSIDVMLKSAVLARDIDRRGRRGVADALRDVIADLRAHPAALPETSEAAMALIAERARIHLDQQGQSPVRAVFNLTGTILHTNLGRAVLPDSAIEAVTLAAGSASSLEFDLETGRRGDRERGLVERLVRLTGAEDATVVNNNAAAVVLALDTLARRREVPISRGELVEIGGAFRMPDIMTRAGCRMREVGTTNRTHLRDYEAVMGPRTAMLLKVHTSNYVVEGFTASVDEAALAGLGRAHGVPLMVDLGSGALIDLARYGLPHEPTPMELLKAGADLVTFSGDKLLGGPQAGLIVGRKDLIQKLRRNPLKRALRLDKMTLAALDAVLRLYEDPERLAEHLPTLRHLARTVADMTEQANRIAPAFQAAIGSQWIVSKEACQSEVGSGSLPGAELTSLALVSRPIGKRGAGAGLERLSARLRVLPMPVIGRVHDGGFWLDLRCLEDEAGFLDQLAGLAPEAEPANAGDAG
jgi:L-seryl-tRNA(Ser) seleniumtransferase